MGQRRFGDQLDACPDRPGAVQECKVVRRGCKCTASVKSRDAEKVTRQVCMCHGPTDTGPQRGCVRRHN